MSDSRLFVWDVELDLVQTFDFSTGLNDQDTEKTQQSLEVAGRYPNLQYWDPSEPKLLVCQAVLAPGKLGAAQEDPKNAEILVSYYKYTFISSSLKRRFRRENFMRQFLFFA